MEEEGIRFVFDYVDPGSYLAWTLLEREIGSAAAAVTTVPLELRLPGQDRLGRSLPEWRALTETLAAIAEAEGLRFAPPDPVPWTRKAHELALHAREKGCLEPVHRALFDAHFVQGRDIGRIDVLVELAAGCGLEPAETGTVLGVDRFGPEVDRIRAGLLAEGVRGVPVLEANGRRLEGFQGADALRSFLGHGGIPS